MPAWREEPIHRHGAKTRRNLRRRMRVLAWRALPLALLCARPALAMESAHTRNTYGEIGMLDMPSAHMSDDGQFSFNFGAINKTQRFTLGLQATPWLETAFRYSHFAPGSQNFDRSFSLKLRLLDEESNFADVSVGVRDLLGTGIYSSEYFLASKHVGAFDLTAGLGWGRLADNATFPNPLRVVRSFGTRAGQASAVGGAVNFGQFFHGRDVGVFGGVAWNTPITGLSVIAEYSSDKYTRERAQSPKSFAVRSPVNLGIAYQIMPSLSAGAGWYYGSSYGISLTLASDPTTEADALSRIGPPIPPPQVRSEAQKRQAMTQLMSRNVRSAMAAPTGNAERERLALSQALLSTGRGVRDLDVQNATLMIDAAPAQNAAAQCASYARIAAVNGTSARFVAVSDLEDGDGAVAFCPITPTRATRPVITQEFERAIRSGFGQQGLSIQAMSIGTSELWVYYNNARYRTDTEAAGRALRVLMRDAPPSVELFHLFPLIAGRAAREITVARSTIERATQGAGSSAEMPQSVSLQPAPLNNPILSRAAARNYPHLDWSVLPGLGDQLFDPDRPLQLLIYASAEAHLWLAPGLSLNGQVSSILWNNYSFGKTSSSARPHVRTDVLRYLDEGRNGISALNAEYSTRLAPELFAKGKAGLLEDIFAGVGGEVLWRPEGSRFALGADGYGVWQRNYDRLFSFLPYKTFTGHVSAYYRSPWYDVDFAVHAGRYLAGDYGATFEVTRRFSTGVEVGAFATFTNVPFSKFGEGSFDKGIIIRIPLEWALPIYTQTSYDLNLHSLNRDGGQRLSNDDSLYRETLGSSYGEFTEHWGDLVHP